MYTAFTVILKKAQSTHCLANDKLRWNITSRMQASGERRRVLHRRPSKGVFYIGGHGFVCKIIEPVSFARYICIAEYRSEQIFRYT